jgi:hypothetical protein
VFANGDLDLYWRFHTRQEHQRIDLEPRPQQLALTLINVVPRNEPHPSRVAFGAATEPLSS